MYIIHKVHRREAFAKWQMRSLALQLKSPQMSSERSNLWKQQWCRMTDNTGSVHFFAIYFSLCIMGCRWAAGREPACSPCPCCSAFLGERGNTVHHPKCPEQGRPRRKERKDSEAVGTLVLQENSDPNSDFSCKVPWRDRLKNNVEGWSNTIH